MIRYFALPIDTQITLSHLNKGTGLVFQLLGRLGSIRAKAGDEGGKDSIPCKADISLFVFCLFRISLRAGKGSVEARRCFIQD